MYRDAGAGNRRQTSVHGKQGWWPTAPTNNALPVSAAVIPDVPTICIHPSVSAYTACTASCAMKGRANMSATEETMADAEHNAVKRCLSASLPVGIVWGHASGRLQRSFDAVSKQASKHIH